MTRALRVLALPLALAAVFVLPGRADAAPSVVDADLAVRTDVQTGPNGNLFVVSLTDGAVYEVFRPGKHDDD